MGDVNSNEPLLTSTNIDDKRRGLPNEIATEERILGTSNLDYNYKKFGISLWLGMLVLLGGAVIAVSSVLAIKIWDYDGDAVNTDTAKILSVVLPLYVAVVVAALLTYYFIVIYRDIRLGDQMITALTRISTVPENDYAFKSAFSRYVSNKTGVNKQAVYDGIKNSIVINPQSYAKDAGEKQQIDNFFGQTSTFSGNNLLPYERRNDYDPRERQIFNSLTRS